MRILLVEDEIDLGAAIKQALNQLTLHPTREFKIEI